MLNRGLLRRWWWLIALLLFDVVFFICWSGCRRGEAGAEEGALVLVEAATMEDAGRDKGEAVEQVDQVVPLPVIPPLRIGFPTAQTNLCQTNDGTVFMPTAAGRVGSALYGSVRTKNSGGRILPSFHEGIDIAPLTRDRRGRAQDPVLAVADGTVAYANRTVGNSNYGRYIVLEHVDPVGIVYTLYAHLSETASSVREGVRVARGDKIGVMGNTPSSIIPLARSHVHLEIGMIRNRRFDAWAKSKKIDNRHGRNNGWNLMGVCPLALYPTSAPERTFSMLDYLAGLPVAFELVIQTKKPIDYFERYPALWRGDGAPKGVLVLAASEGGAVLYGRLASAAEQAKLGKGSQVVLSVDGEVLGRNGLRLVVERNGRWELGQNGRQWLDILMF